MKREFAIAIEVIADVSDEDWDTVPIQEAIDKVALNVIGAILENNPEYEVRRLQTITVEAWA